MHADVAVDDHGRVAAGAGGLENGRQLLTALEFTLRVEKGRDGNIARPWDVAGARGGGFRSGVKLRCAGIEQDMAPG
ncbi:MAG: hypothetical protein WHU10_07730, partial [Fimbriimonadales bacterium]